MNIVRFNEPFETCVRAYPDNVDPPCPFTKWQHAPLFQYFSTRAKEMSLIRSMLSGGIHLEEADWPFETFRLSISQYCDKKWIEDGRECGSGQYRVDLVVTRRSERVYFLGNIIRLYDETPATMELARRYNPLMVYMADCYTTLDNPETYQFRTNTFAGGRWLNSAISGDLAGGMVDALAGFIMDSMVPSNHIVEVRPDEPSRSVEWIKARTHYTLITHGHPANRRSVQEGQRVTVDREKELTRMAHDRKGHYKTLRHPRFKYALNEKRYADKPPGTIYVKPCWVGPKEWREEGGKQIYKILEPVSEELKACAA